jgi:hypothetical protein
MGNMLKNIAAVGTILTGLYSLIAPTSVQEFTGLELPGSRGVTEVRAILGGFFIALGTVPLVFRSPEMFLMLGIAYLCVALVRSFSMFLDRSLVKSNFISLAVELIFGLILVL